MAAGCVGQPQSVHPPFEMWPSSSLWLDDQTQCHSPFEMWPSLNDTTASTSPPISSSMTTTGKSSFKMRFWVFVVHTMYFREVGIDLSRNILSSYLVLKYTKNIHRFEIEVLQWKGPQGCLCVGCTFAKLSSKLLSLRVLGGVRAYWPPPGAFGTCGSGGRHHPTNEARLSNGGQK